MQRYHFFIALITYFIFEVRSSTDYHHLSDYFQWIDSQPANIQKAFMLPPDAKDALFTYQLRNFLPQSLPKHSSYKDIDFIMKETMSRFYGYKGIQFTLSYHKALRNTLMVYFLPTMDDYDACVDLQKGYQNVQLFSQQHGENHIALHYGIITSLFAKSFNDHFASKMQQLATRMHEETIDHLIIAGHSMGGAYAQAFYILLHGDYTHVPESVRALRQIIQWMDTSNTYDDENAILQQCVINHKNKDKIKVLTTGAFLIVSSASKVNEHIITDNVVNFIKRKDPVPMVFGGTVTNGEFARIRKGDITSKGVFCSDHVLKGLMRDARAANEKGFLGTATIFGKYYVVSKKEPEIKKAHRTYKQVRGKMLYDDRFELKVRVTELVDGMKDHQYLSQHLKQGNKQLAQMRITLIPETRWSEVIGKVTLSEVLFGLKFAMNHNEYYNDFESYIFSDKYFKLNGNRNAMILFELRAIQWRKKKEENLHKRETAAHRIESEEMHVMDDERELQRLFSELHRLERYQRYN